MTKNIITLAFVTVSIFAPVLLAAQSSGSHTSVISEIMLYDGTYPGAHIKFVKPFRCAYGSLPITNDYARFSLLSGDEMSNFESGVAMLLSAKATGATVKVNYDIYGGYGWIFPWINCSVRSIEMH